MEEKKEFIVPEIEIVRFETTDVITTSDGLGLPDAEWE